MASRRKPEYELVDTGVFDESRYFDVVVEYAKVAREDLCIRISISNRGPETASIEVLPTLWFRNTWSWGRDPRRPSITTGNGSDRLNGRVATLVAKHWQLGDYILYGAGADQLLFTENETNTARLHGVAALTPYVQDAFHEYVVYGKTDAVNPEAHGTKAAARYSRRINAGETMTLDLRLACWRGGAPMQSPLTGVDALFNQRQQEADECYAVVLPPNLSADAKLVARQAFAGMLWSKQYSHYVITDWLEGDLSQPPAPAQRLEGHNQVIIFGSARAQAGSITYEETKRVAAALSAMDCDILTGGGPGLIQAANEGAETAKNAGQSVGIRVEFPFKQQVNPFVQQGFEHRTFLPGCIISCSLPTLVSSRPAVSAPGLKR